MWAGISWPLWAWRRLRERGRAGVAVFVNRLDGEEIIVFREALHHVFGHVPDVDDALPERLVGLAPDDAVAGDVRLGVRLPRQSRVVFLTRRFETDARWRGGPQSHRRHRRRVDAGDLRDVWEIDHLDHVAVFYPFLFADALVLAREILIRFREPHRRIAALQEGVVIAAAPVTIPAEDQSYFEIVQVALGGLFDIAGELRRRAVVFASVRLAYAGFRLGLGRRHAFRKDPDARIIFHAAAAQRVPDNVVGEHSRDIQLLLLRLLGPMRGAEQPLFFARDG